uniref:Uncharacterized protein n=1 Tax=Chenopodium quinoa TaxID=63459 RepID=A0A803N2H9_CHEQI
MGKYCSYCHDYGHDIEGCFDVTHVVQQLIDDGKILIPKGWIPPILSFTNADLPRVINFSQPLCVTLGCNYRRISGILVDNKSNFNICSKESLYFAILKAKTSKDEKDCPKVSAIGNSGMSRNRFDLHQPYSDQLVDSFDTILPEHESYAGVLCHGNRLSESSMILQRQSNHQEWTFTEADLPPNPWHTRELHITLRHGRSYINHILVDNESALDICSREFLYRLGYTDSFINPLSYTILGFDDTPREVTGSSIWTRAGSRLVRQAPFNCRRSLSAAFSHCPISVIFSSPSCSSMAGTSNNEQQNSSFSLDPFVELKGMMQAIIERQDTVE